MRTAEESILAAALDGEHAEVKDRIKELLPGERRSLEKACLMIRDLIRTLEITLVPVADGSPVAEAKKR